MSSSHHQQFVELNSQPPKERRAPRPLFPCGAGGFVGDVRRISVEMAAALGVPVPPARSLPAGRWGLRWLGRSRIFPVLLRSGVLV